MDFDAVISRLPQREGSFGPCYAFSVHKCGSTMMNNMIRVVSERQDIPAVTLPDRFFNEGIPPRVWAHDPALLPAFSRNLLYYGFRLLPPVFTNPDFALRERRFVLLVRDPRDALVSQYFSYGRKGGSHRLPKKGAGAILKSMEEAGDEGIDDYVLREAALLEAKLRTYRNQLNFDLGLVRRYEDVFFEKAAFLVDILEHFGIEVPGEVIAEVAAQFDIRPEVEDQSKHIRKGTPGDHVEKLAPDTIARLNDTFRETARFYGYAL